MGNSWGSQEPLGLFCKAELEFINHQSCGNNIPGGRNRICKDSGAIVWQIFTENFMSSKYCARLWGYRGKLTRPLSRSLVNPCTLDWWGKRSQTSSHNLKRHDSWGVFGIGHPVVQSVLHRGSQYLGIVTIIPSLVGPEIKFCSYFQKESDFRGLAHIDKTFPNYTQMAHKMISDEPFKISRLIIFKQIVCFASSLVIFAIFDKWWGFCTYGSVTKFHFEIYLLMYSDLIQRKILDLISEIMRLISSKS